MLQEVEFLFDNKLIEAVESLIKQAKKSLLLISPYIDLDPRIREALEEKKERPDFKLQILFGKNEKDFLKSIKQKSLDFLKSFPNVQIRYNSRLHAKYYQNESHYIMTSMNLFDYSLKHNIEAGVRSQYKGRGFLAKVADSAAGIVTEGVERVKQDLLGQAADTDPVQKFEKIFLTSDRMYETSPIFKEEGALRSLIGSKTIEGYNVDLDNFKQIQVEAIGHDTAVTSKKVPYGELQNRDSETKYYSGSQLAKSLGCQLKDLTNLVEAKGLVNNGTITKLGALKGLMEKSYMGNKYIAYPGSLEDLAPLKS